MTSLLDWLTTLAFVLNDDEPGREFARYPTDKLLAALNQALCLVAKYRPDLFTEYEVVKLRCGPHQDVRGCCPQVLEVIEQTDDEGNIIAEIKGSRKTSTKNKRVWKKPSCLAAASIAPDGYVIRSADIDMNMNGRFDVFPPVPPGVDAFVRIKCVKAPGVFEEGHLDRPVLCGGRCDMMVAAWHYALAVMLSGDRFDNAAGSQNASQHYQMFFTVLGITERQEEKIESPERARQ